MLKILDRYILKKFIGTFFFSIALMLAIFIVVDVSEKLPSFISEKIPFKEILLDHYLNFIPYYGNLFSPLFTFIAVIFFTAKMAYKTEFVAILSSGTSFKRILRPYMIGATIITILSLVLNHFIIPKSNKIRIGFEDRYINGSYNTEEKNIHRQMSPGVSLYMSTYDNSINLASQVSIEKTVKNKQVSMTKAESMRWDSIQKLWILSNVFERTLFYDGIDTIKRKTKHQFYKETHRFYPEKKIRIDFSPKDMTRMESKREVMTYFELKKYIIKEQEKGSSGIDFFRVEMYKRTAFPFATFFLTIIGVSISSRKIRGGVGLHIALGLLLSCIYILSMHVCTTFGNSGIIHPILAVWIPNIIFSIVAFSLYKKAQQ